MSWFFVAPAAVGEGQVRLDPEQTHHLLDVLRARPGDRFTAVCAGVAYLAELTVTGQRQAVGRLLSADPLQQEPAVAVTLFQGLPKGDKLEWIIQKCTELGAVALVPVTTERTVARVPADKEMSRVERWQRIAREAAEQSHRGAVPQVGRPETWPAAVARARAFDLSLVLWEGLAAAGAGVGLREVLAARPFPATVALYVGPEGGLAAAEVQQAEAAGARAIRLGPRILRTETAALAALAALLYAAGDF